MQQSCIISQRKTDWVGGEFLCGSVVLWFVCVNLRDLRETLGFRLSNIDRVRLRVILPQITQITQRNAAKLHYIAEKDRLFEAVAVIAVLLFWGFVCVNLRDQRENRPFHLC